MQTMSHDSDLDLFQQMMGDVKRIDHDTIRTPESTSRYKSLHLAKREAAMWLSDDEKDYLSLDYSPMVKPERRYCLQERWCSGRRIQKTAPW